MKTIAAVVTCPACSVRLKSSAAPGKRIACPKCRNTFRSRAVSKPDPKPAVTLVRCPGCSVKLSFKNLKPGGKFRCSKCGAPGRSKADAIPAPSPAPKLAAASAPTRPTRATAPAPESDPDTENVLIETMSDVPAATESVRVTPEEPEPPPVKAPARQSKPVTTAPARPRRKNDDDDENAPSIAPKLLVVAIAVFSLGFCVLGYTLFSAFTGGESRAEIAGDVTLDGALVAEGSILLTPLDGKSSLTAAAQIKEGKYSIPRAQGPGLGMYKIEIRAPKKSGRKVQKAMGKPGEMVDELVEAVHERFNAKSELKFDVQSGRNIANFKVFSK